MYAEGRGGDLVEAGRLRQARDRCERIARARASVAGGAAAAAAAGAALAAAAVEAAAAADPAACEDMMKQAACVRDSMGVQGMVQEGDGGGKDSDGDACEDANMATIGGGAKGGDVPKTRPRSEGESGEVEDGVGAQAGTVAAAAGPAEAAGTVVGWESEVS